MDREKLEFDQRSRMNKTVVAVVAVVAVACLIGLYIWSSHNRFYIMTGSKGVAYEVDRKTGESWMLYGDRKIPQQGGGESREKEEEFPSAAASQVTGSASLSLGWFSGKLYNGSDWVVTRVIVSVSAKEEDGTVRWTRDLSEAVTIRPLTTESFSITVEGDQGIKEAPWSLKKVFGYKE
jgi:hypothetical protein